MALEPFFCSIFDEEDKLVKEISWSDAKKGSSFIWVFLNQEKIFEKNITFLGGISGPGGFSNLRVAGTILNTLKIKFATSLHQVRSDMIISEMINIYNQENPQNIKPQNIVLNSFGKGVFFVEEKKLIRKNLQDCTKQELERDYCVSFLPENKKKYFKNNFNIPLQNFKNICLKILNNQDPIQTFCPDYECPAVQK